mgnify:FL=1
MYCRSEVSKNDFIYRIKYLLTSLRSYLRRTSFPNDRLYNILQDIESNVSTAIRVDSEQTNIYLVNALNYLENLNNNYIRLYG